MRHEHYINYHEDLMDYPVSEALWWDAYQLGLTPHRPPDCRPSGDPEFLRERIETLELQLSDLRSQLDRDRISSTRQTVARQLTEAATPTGDPLIDQLRQASLAYYAGRYTELRQSEPDRWRGPCPLHSDDRRSFYVWANPWRWECYACGRSGDIFTFAEAIRAQGRQ